MTGPESVKQDLTLVEPPAQAGAPARPAVETPEYAAFCRRIIRAYSRRVAAADEVDLADMLRVRDEMDAAIAAAVMGQRAQGRSWAYIAAGLGTTRQAAQMRYGRKASA